MEPESIGPGFRDQVLTVVRRRPPADWRKSGAGSFNRPSASSPLYHPRLHGNLPVSKLINVLGTRAEDAPLLHAPGHPIRFPARLPISVVGLWVSGASRRSS